MSFRASFLLPFVVVPAFAVEQRGDNPDAKPSAPEVQRQLFRLPPGFEIQLVADETQIQKPMNINFDAQGRLWVTGSELYPFAAKTDALGQPIENWEREWNAMSGSIGAEKPQPPPAAIDSVRVLSDFDEDGRARKVEVFADGLNVPIGIQPLPRAPGAKGDTAIVYSIPTIWRMEDRDGDGRADVREPLYTGFGFRDTHGMSSNYIPWTDGWIHGCHGFANRSEIRDRNGNVTVIESGSTYRFKPDGSAFEIYTHGQTNPFGLTIDRYGNLYSADSHSKPAYMLIRGGYYEGIGKKHDGLGFAPAMMQHSHGSSSIAGIAYYSADQWPEEYRDNLFIGNPVTRRINRDRLEWHGSTPRAIEMPDFLVCDDPWFRPVQVKLGPDGALWIADFYNPIIGHYEQPLMDPRRDHQHGRIWRIVWKGGGDGAHSAKPESVTRVDNSVAEAVKRRKALKPEASFANLFQFWDATDEKDSAAIYAVRMALRDKLGGGADAEADQIASSDAARSQRLADIALAVPGVESARFILRHLQRADQSSPAHFSHVVRHLPDGELGALTELVTKRPAGVTVAAAIVQAGRERGGELPGSLAEWSRRAILAAIDSQHEGEAATAIAALRESSDPGKLEPLVKIVESQRARDGLRVAALEAVMNLPEASGIAARALRDASSLPLQRKAAELLGSALTGHGVSAKQRSDAIQALLESLPSAAAELGTVIAASLSKDDESCAVLLGAIEQGRGSPSLLRSRFVALILSGRSAGLRDRATALTRDLPPEDVRIQQIIASRLKVYHEVTPDGARGKAIFQTHCAVCHKLRGEGGSLAPNLDGVGRARGLHRLVEDILDPNRNVDGTFRQSIIETHSGQIHAGVNLRESASGITITDATGKDVSVAKNDIRSQTTSPLSLMPAMFEQTIPEGDFADLLAYLLSN